MTYVAQCVVKLPHVSGLPEDTAENVFNVGVFNGHVLTGGERDAVLAAIVGFYNDTPPTLPQELAFYISESISRSSNACTILMYEQNDLTGEDPMGSPIDMVNFTLEPVASGTPLPEEVAYVVSYNADLTNVPVTETNPSPPPAIIRPAQRRRGRTYVGPITGIAVTETGNRARPSGDFQVVCAESFKVMANAIEAVHSDVGLGVWSKSDGAIYRAIECHTDNEWDTQRRRGPDADSRYTATF